MFSIPFLLSFLFYIILSIHSHALAANIDSRVTPERGVIASVKRIHFFHDKSRPKPPFVPHKSLRAHVLFVDEKRCLEIAPVDWTSSQNPYFVSFASLYLGNSVEWFMGSGGNSLAMGVSLRPITLVPVNGIPPLIMRSNLLEGTHLKGFAYDMIFWAFLFMEEKKVRPTIEDAMRMLQAPVAGRYPADFHKLLWGLSADGRPARFREGMIGTVSHKNFKEDPSLPSLPWERRRKFPLVLFLNQNYWCLEMVPDKHPFDKNEYFVSFDILGLQDLVMNLMNQTVPMGVLLRRIHLIPAGGNPPDVKSLHTSSLQDKKLPKEAFGRIYAALKFMDMHGRKPDIRFDMEAMQTLVSACVETLCSI